MGAMEAGRGHDLVRLTGGHRVTAATVHVDVDEAGNDAATVEPLGVRRRGPVTDAGDPLAVDLHPSGTVAVGTDQLVAPQELRHVAFSSNAARASGQRVGPSTDANAETSSPSAARHSPSAAPTNPASSPNAATARRGTVR